jgi:crotonobetainyl-CoA:carnitine CoA-transferase CaiB-like acyl-CoA transferase
MTAWSVDNAAISCGSIAGKNPSSSISPARKRPRCSRPSWGGADVFVQNLKPGAVDKLGFSFERLRRDDPALIVCSISGYVERLSSKLAAADIAFARINDMAGLARHPQLRRITLNSPNGPISYPAPAPRRAGETRHYAAIPALGEHTQKVRAEFLGDAARQGERRQSG